MSDEIELRRFVRQTLHEAVSNILEIGAPVPMHDPFPTLEDFKEDPNEYEHILKEKSIYDDKPPQGIDKIFQKTDDKLK